MAQIDGLRQRGHGVVGAIHGGERSPLQLQEQRQRVILPGAQVGQSLKDHIDHGQCCLRFALRQRHLGLRIRQKASPDHHQPVARRFVARQQGGCAFDVPGGCLSQRQPGAHAVNPNRRAAGAGQLQRNFQVADCFRRYGHLQVGDAQAQMPGGLPGLVVDGGGDLQPLARVLQRRAKGATDRQRDGQPDVGVGFPVTPADLLCQRDGLLASFDVAAGGQHHQRGGHTLPVAQRLEQRQRAAIMRHAGRSVAGDAVGGRDQVQGGRQARLVALDLHDGQRLLMQHQRLQRLADVSQPVAQPVQRARQRGRFIQQAGHGQRLLEVTPGLGIVAGHRQKAEVVQRLPLASAVVPGARLGQQGLEVGLGRGKVAHHLLRLAARLSQRARQRLLEMLSRRCSAIEMSQGGVGRETMQSLRAGRQPVIQRRLPEASLEAVIRQLRQAVVALPGLARQKGGDDAVLVAALAAQQPGIDRLAGERVAKGKGVGRLFHHQPGRY